jgi:hypothetical protein
MADAQRDSFGPFRVRGDMGPGRFGPVFRAEAADTGEPVVIRTVQGPMEPAQRRAFVEALEWLCSTPLDHPALGRPVACGVEGETPYVVQAFVPGTPLDEFLDRRGPQPVDETIVRLTQLAGALDFAAVAGVHHAALDRRDILLSAHQSAVVGVGLAQAAAQAGLLFEAGGPYQSPQQRAGEPPVAADDVYALAVVALQLLCGRADNHDAPVDLLDTLQEAGLAPALHAVFEAALSDDPRARPATGLAFAAALQDALVPGEDAAFPPDIHGADGAAALAAPPQHDERFVDLAMPEAATGAAGDVLRRSEPTARPDDLPLLLDASSPGGPADAAETPWRQAVVERGRARRGRRPEAGSTDDTTADRLQLAAGDERAAPVVAPLPFDLAIDERVQPEPRRPAAWPDDAVGDTPMDADAVGDRSPRVFAAVDAWAEPEPPVWRRGWAVAAVALLVMVVAGASVVWMAARSTESVPFPRSAAPIGASAGDLELETPVPGVEGPTRIPDEPRLPATGLPGDVPDAIAEPIDPPDTGLPATSPSPPAAAPVAQPTPPAAPAPGAAPAPAPAPPPAEPGRVLVRSTPAGAQVFVNGEPRGPTPLAVRDLALGAHTIEVRHPSYPPRQQRVTLTADAPARSVDFELDRPPFAAAAPAPADPVTGALRVESRPAGAQVFVDDRLVGVTPLLVPDVAAGSRVVRIELPGYRRWTTSVSVGSGEQVRVAASLEP